MAGRLRVRAVVAAVGTAALLAACTGSGSDQDGATDDGADDLAAGDTPGEVSRPPSELRWRTSGSDVVCDGADHKAGTIEQARPGEVIDFTTALPVDSRRARPPTAAPRGLARLAAPSARPTGGSGSCRCRGR